MRTLQTRLMVPSPGLCVVAALLSPSAVADSRSDAISSAVDYCSDPTTAVDEERTSRLSEDHTILCFDGRISAHLDLWPLRQLENNGFFVIRSIGGDIFMAMKIADALWEKNATVIIRVANAILIASKRSYVLADTIIAWHGGLADCEDPEVAAALARLHRSCTVVDWAGTFFAKRGIDRRYTIKPPTHYTRKMFDIVLQAAPNKRAVFWMWHPKSHGDHFKDRIVYESYPDSQESVDAIVRRFRLYIRVVYDPEE